MIEFVLGVLMSPWVFAALILFAVLAEAGVSRAGDYSGWSIVWSVPLAIMGYLFFRDAFPDVQVTLPNALMVIGAYAILGTLWSLWRYRCYVHDAIAHVKTHYGEKLHDRSKYHTIVENTKYETSPRNNMGFIVFNLALFPISFVAHMLEDILRGVHAFVKKYMIGIFNAVHKKLFTGLE